MMRNPDSDKSATGAGGHDWPATRVLRKRAVAAVADCVRAGAGQYDRQRMLPRLIAAGPDEVGADSAPPGAHILRLLARALRQERALGRAGHWTYDLNRHIGLAQAYAAERARGAVNQPPGGSAC